jgi:hypothetical protein
LWRRRKCLYTCSVGEGSLGTGHQWRQADQGQGWARPKGRGLLGRVEVAAWRGNGGGPAGKRGLGGLGRPAGQGRVGVVAGPADMGRAEVADFLGVRIREGKAVFQKYAFSNGRRQLGRAPPTRGRLGRDSELGRPRGGGPVGRGGVAG